MNPIFFFKRANSQKNVEQLVESLFYVKQQGTNPDGSPKLFTADTQYKPKLDIGSGTIQFQGSLSYRIKIIPPKKTDASAELDLGIDLDVRCALGDIETLEKKYNEFKIKIEKAIAPLERYRDAEKSAAYLNNPPADAAIEQALEHVKTVRQFGTVAVELNLDTYVRAASKSFEKLETMQKLGYNVPQDAIKKLGDALNACSGMRGMYNNGLSDNCIALLALSR